MSAKIANRDTVTDTKTCTVCMVKIKPVRVIKRGKKRMVNTCGCGFQVNNGADINILL